MYCFYEKREFFALFKLLRAHFEWIFVFPVKQQGLLGKALRWALLELKSSYELTQNIGDGQAFEFKYAHNQV